MIDLLPILLSLATLIVAGVALHRVLRLERTVERQRPVPRRIRRRARTYDMLRLTNL